MYKKYFISLEVDASQSAKQSEMKYRSFIDSGAKLRQKLLQESVSVAVCKHIIAGPPCK